MRSVSNSVAILAVMTGLASVTTALTGKTTRYWDCCKGSCSWPGKASVSSPVKTCDISDNPLADSSAQSGCSGGSAYMCSDQSPWAVDDSLAYGFAAVKLAGGSESSWCCACYKLTFTSGSVAGKTMIIQATNTGGDLGDNHFDLAIPGGGVGIFNGCTNMYGAPPQGWGAQYGGISSRSDCDSFPAHLKPGCYWRFDWFNNADNPTVEFEQVTCPAAITAKTGCVRTGETPTEVDSVEAPPAATPSGPRTFGDNDFLTVSAPVDALPAVPSSSPAVDEPEPSGPRTFGDNSFLTVSEPVEAAPAAPTSAAAILSPQETVTYVPSLPTTASATTTGYFSYPAASSSAPASTFSTGYFSYPVASSSSSLPAAAVTPTTSSPAYEVSSSSTTVSLSNTSASPVATTSAPAYQDGGVCEIQYVYV